MFMAKRSVLCVFTGVFLIGCSNVSEMFSPKNYNSESVGEDIDTYECEILSVTPVNVKDFDTNNVIGGGALGGVLGGILGSQIGGGSGRIATTIVGAVAGTAGGAAIGSAVSKSQQNNAYQYVVKMNGTGKLKTIVQGKEPELCVGEKVYLLIGRCNNHTGKRVTRCRLIRKNQVNNF